MISERLKKLRDELGYNQEGIAATVGMKQRTWSDWEKKPPDALQWLTNISLRYSVSIDWLLGLTDDPTPKRNSIQDYPRRGTEIIDSMRAMSAAEQDALVQIAKILSDIESKARQSATAQLLQTITEPVEDLLGEDAAEELYQAVDLLRRTGDQSALLSWLTRYLGDDESSNNRE